MTFEDKTLQCADCGNSFIHSAEDQEFYQSKGYTNEPKRCMDCRRARKADRQGGSFGAPRQMYEAICAECGKTAEVPFQPRGDKPVYCSDCFRSMNPRR